MPHEFARDDVSGLSEGRAAKSVDEGTGCGCEGLTYLGVVCDQERIGDVRMAIQELLRGVHQWVRRG